MQKTAKETAPSLQELENHMACIETAMTSIEKIITTDTRRLPSEEQAFAVRASSFLLSTITSVLPSPVFCISQLVATLCFCNEVRNYLINRQPSAWRTLQGSHQSFYQELKRMQDTMSAREIREMQEMQRELQEMQWKIRESSSILASYTYPDTISGSPSIPSATRTTSVEEDATHLLTPPDGQACTPSSPEQRLCLTDAAVHVAGGVRGRDDMHQLQSAGKAAATDQAATTLVDTAELKLQALREASKRLEASRQQIEQLTRLVAAAAAAKTQPTQARDNTH